MSEKISIGMAGLNERPHVLYRFYDPSDVLLYVGITADPTTRMKSHRREKSWWDRVANIRVEHHPTRRAALDAERAAIEEEQPLFNDQHNHFVTATDSAAEFARELLEIFGVEFGGDKYEEIAARLQAEAEEDGEPFGTPELEVARRVAEERAEAFWSYEEIASRLMRSISKAKLKEYRAYTAEKHMVAEDEVSADDMRGGVLILVSEDLAWETLSYLPAQYRAQWMRLAGERNPYGDFITLQALEYSRFHMAGTLEQELAREDAWSRPPWESAEPADGG